MYQSILRFGRTVVYAGQTMNTTAPCDDCDGLCVKRTTDKTTSVDVCLCGDTASKDGCSSATPTCGEYFHYNSESMRIKKNLYN